MQKTVLVMGLDEWHRKELQTIDQAESFDFVPFLEKENIIYIDNVDFDALLERGRKQLSSFEQVDAIITHWDFPATALKPILCQELGLHSASLSSVLKCGHKYWSRVEQMNAVPKATPEFSGFDPFSEDPLAEIDMEYPFWIKPVKAYGSQLGFRIDSKEDFDEAIQRMREGIGDFADPFNDALKYVDMPPELEGIGGDYCIAEEIIGGHQLAPEGYVLNGEVHIHGVIDLVKDEGKESFNRYAYPSTMPREVQDHAIDATKRLMKAIGFDNDCFNIEFFWDEEKDKLCLIEINPRISQSHSYLFHQVDGMSNHEVAVRVALGEEPHLKHEGGDYNCAAKFMWRKYEDAVVESLPSKEEVEEVEEAFPGVRVQFKPKPGERLSETKNQDSYSYILAEITLGAQDEQELVERFERACEMLTFKFRD